MDLNLLRVLTTVFETRSVTGAADRLCITQPSVSYALKRLRDELNDPLFIRNNLGMEPTLRAEQLYQVFKRTLGEIDRAVAETKSFDSFNSHHKFTLAMSDISEFFFLPFIYRHLQQQAPNVSLDVVQLDTNSLEDWLMSGKVDAALCNRNGKLNNVLCDVLIQDQYVCLLNKHHPRIKDSLSMEAFLAEKHVMVSSQAGHHHVEERVRQAGHEINVSLQVPHFSALGQLVSATESLTTLPASIAEMYIQTCEGKILPLPFEVPDVEVCLYRQLDSGDLAAKSWFCEQLIKICREKHSLLPQVDLLSAI